MLGRESFQEYDDMLFEALNSFYRNVLKSKFHKYNRVYGNIEVNTNSSNNHNMTYELVTFELVKEREEKYVSLQRKWIVWFEPKI